MYRIPMAVVQKCAGNGFRNHSRLSLLRVQVVQGQGQGQRPGIGIMGARLIIGPLQPPPSPLLCDSGDSAAAAAGLERCLI